jgi:anhydro-N-acetylmuramic acid kinase
LLAIDRLAQRLTRGAERFDPGGRLGAQGHLREEWIESWLEFFREAPVARELPHLVDGNLHDALRVATHALAVAVAERLSAFLGPQSAETEIVLVGGGRRNGLLLREIMSRLPADAAIHSVAEIGLRDESLTAASTAILAMLFVDRVAGNLPHLTGAEGSRILGRLTPGASAPFRRLLVEMTSRSPETLTLRDAV